MERTRDARGITIYELMLVVVMIAILSALAWPRLDFQRYRVNSDARGMSMTLLGAQRLAVSLQHNVVVTVDPATGHVATHEDRNNDGIYTADERVRGFQLSAGVVFARNGAPDLPAPAATDEINRVTFARDGSASPAGVIFLNTKRGVGGGENEDARAIEIARATGRATWYSYTGREWSRGT